MQLDPKRRVSLKNLSNNSYFADKVDISECSFLPKI
jgi:hypothetical protein